MLAQQGVGLSNDFHVPTIHGIFQRLLNSYSSCRRPWSDDISHELKVFVTTTTVTGCLVYLYFSTMLMRATYLLFHQHLAAGSPPCYVPVIPHRIKIIYTCSFVVAHPSLRHLVPISYIGSPPTHCQSHGQSSKPLPRVLLETVILWGTQCVPSRGVCNVCPEVGK